MSRRRPWLYERSTQFMGRIGNKAALGLSCALQRGQHLVKRLHDLYHFVTSARLRDALTQVA